MTANELLENLPRPFVSVQVSACGWSSEEWAQGLMAAFPLRSFVLWGEPSERAFTQAVACALVNLGKQVRTYDRNAVELGRGVTARAWRTLNRTEAAAVIQAEL